MHTFCHICLLSNSRTANNVMARDNGRIRAHLLICLHYFSVYCWSLKSPHVIEMPFAVLIKIVLFMDAVCLILNDFFFFKILKCVNQFDHGLHLSLKRALVLRLSFFSRLTFTKRTIFHWKKCAILYQWKKTWNYNEFKNNKPEVSCSSSFISKSIELQLQLAHVL